MTDSTDTGMALRSLYAPEGGVRAIFASNTAIAWSFFHIVWLYRFFVFEITLRLI